jgi:hypothetical protein
MHSSQIELPSSRQDELHDQYPALSEFVFFTIECIPNFELHSLLYSYGQKLVVLSPDTIRVELKEEAERQADLYSRI